MKPFQIILILSIIFFSCKKDNGSKTSDSSLLVKTITSKIHKIDSSGHYYTVVDSFQYDNQNRVTQYMNLQYDTSYPYDLNGNIIVKPNVITNLATMHYTGNNSVPSSFLYNGQTVTLTADNSGQIIIDSASPGHAAYFTFNSGLVVGKFWNTISYSMDSISIDANGNATSFIFGGNYQFDSLNHPIYGRIASWKYGYGSILNPVFANRSAAAIIFLFRNEFYSKNIRESIESVEYAQNSVVVSDKISQYQNIVDANNVIQKSMNTANDEFIAWTYY